MSETEKQEQSGKSAQGKGSAVERLVMLLCSEIIGDYKWPDI